jgi:hypothetical protein
MSGTESILVRMHQAMQGLRDATRQANTEADRLRQNFAAIDAAARDAIANGFTGRGNFRNYLPQGSDDFTNLQRQQARDHAVSLLNQQSPSAGHHNIGATVASAVRNEAGQFFRATMQAAGAASATAFAFQGAQRAVGLNLDSDKLMRLTGGLAGGFDDVLSGLDKMANQVTMAEDEMAKLAVTMAKLGGIVDTSTIPGLVKTSRAFGMEDNRIPMWMSEMKWRGASSPDLLPMLAATMARTGMGGRGEELLDAFQEYADRTEKVLLHTGDMSGFAMTMAAMGSMTNEDGSPIAGLKGAAGAQLLKQLDSGFQRSGAGESGEVARAAFLASMGITNPYHQEYIKEEGISGKPEMLEAYMNFMPKYVGATGNSAEAGYMLDDAIARDLGISRHVSRKLRNFKTDGGNLIGFGNWLESTTGKGFADIKQEAFPDLTKIWNVSEAAKSGNFNEATTGSLMGLLQQYKIDPNQHGGVDPSNYGNLIEVVAKAAMNGPEATAAEEHRKMMKDIDNMQMEAGKTLLSGAVTFYDAVKEFVGDKPDPVTGKTRAEKHQEYSDRTMQSPSAQERGYAYPMLDPLLDWWKGDKTEAAPTVPGDKTTSLLGTIGLGVGEAIAGRNGLLGLTSGNANAATLPGELTPEQRGGGTLNTSAAPKKAAPYMDAVQAAAKKHGVDPALLAGLIEHESGWNPNAKSKAGAVGLGQFMPETAKRFGITDRTDPNQSIDGAAAYLKSNLDLFGGDVSKTLAAYNAGEGAVKKYGGIPPYKETQAYVPAVLASAKKYAGTGAVASSSLTASTGVKWQPGTHLGTKAIDDAGSGGMKIKITEGTEAPVKWEPGVHLGTKSTDGGAAASGGMVIGIGGGTEAPVKWEPGVHLGTKRIDDGGAPAAGGDVKWEPGVHLGTKRIDDYNMQLPEGTSAAASARDAPSAVRDMLSSMGGPGGELGRMVGDMRATIDVVQKSDMGEVLSQHSRQFALSGVPRPQHMAAGAKAMMGAAQGLMDGFSGALARR